MACDGHVISPLFFPGGDIGCLAVHGTVNDVAMLGATPLYLAASFIIEEGFPLADLKRIVDSMAAAAREAGVPVVTGDTKVVEQGKGDGVFISTTGVGALPEGRQIGGARARVVTEDAHHFVQMTTAFGGQRVVDWLSGEPLPRIC
jgi:hydrogenase expression/formation protein HypE